MLKSILSAIALSIFSFATVQAAAPDSAVSYMSDVDGRYREHNTDFQKISINVRFVPREGKVIGSETLTFTPIQPLIDSVYLDAPGMTIKKVMLDQQAQSVSYESNKEGVIIRFKNKLKWEEKHSLYIEYEATPRKGLYFVGWNDEKNLSRKQIWTQGQGIDNRYWFPCYDDVDDKVLTETTVTFDSTYRVISNGNLLSATANHDGTKTWHYAMTKPHSPYLVMIAIDKYAYRDYKSNNGITSRQYYYADHPEVVAPTYEYSKEVMDWLAKEIGVPYPWQSYSNTPVQEFMFGAMENTTATIYGDFFQVDQRGNIDRPYIGVNAHELTHQWFGDDITEYSGPHHWLHESFATYYSKIFLRHIYGEDQYEWTKRGEANQAIQVNKENRFPIAHTKAGTPRFYPNGSFVIGMLRYVVGDEVYRKSIRHYLTKHTNENVDTHDFYRAFMETAGINLDWFFDEWILHAGIPAYDVKYNAASDKTTFYIHQTHATDSLTHLFRMPIVFEVHYADGTKDSVRTDISHRMDTVQVANNAHKPISYTLFDPGFNVLKTVTISKAYAEWLAQAGNAPYMIDRYDAIHALRDTSMDRKLDDLIAIYGKEKSQVIRAEIVHQLGSDINNEKSIAILKKAVKDQNFNVRRAVIEIDSIPATLVADCERLLLDSSYVTIEAALRKLIKQHPQNKDNYLATTKATIGTYHNVRIAWLELGCSGQTDEKWNELVDYTSHSYEFTMRNKAMIAVEHLGYANDKLIANLVDAILSPNGRLAGPANKVLKKLMAKQEIKDMATTYYKANTWNDWQQEKLKDIFEKSEK